MNEVMHIAQGNLDNYEKLLKMSLYDYYSYISTLEKYYQKLKSHQDGKT